MDESVKKRRGRQRGQIKEYHSIKDPILGKYHIRISKGSYDIMIEGNEKPIGFCSSLPNALKYIMKQESPKPKDVYSIKEYINELKEFFDNQNKLYNAVKSK